jgi:hypothetical protein
VGGDGAYHFFIIGNLPDCSEPFRPCAALWENRKTNPDVMKIVQNGALVLEKKRSAFYFHQDGDL